MNRMRYPEEKLTLRFTLAFLLGFFAALLVSWCGREYYLQKAGLISDFYLRRLKYKNLEGRRLFGSFLGKRMKWAALFPGILLLGAAEPVMLLAGGWLGFAFGVVVSLSVLKFGFFGIGVGLLFTIPQGLFYVAGALVMFQGLADWKWNFANWLAFPGRKLMTGTFFFFLGILTESFVSLWNLRLLFYLI